MYFYIHGKLKNNIKMSKRKEKSMVTFSVNVGDGTDLTKGTIIQRAFWIDDYNPDTKYNIELRNTVDEIVELLLKTIRMQDINYICDKYDLRFKEKWVGKTGKTYSKNEA